MPRLNNGLNTMKEYDVVVIGSGAGMIVVNEALASGLRVALVDKGPVGGTCLNLGCIPSKMLTAAADRVMEIREAARLGIQSRIEDIDFRSIMERMRNTVGSSSRQLRSQILNAKGLDFYEDTGSFTGDGLLYAKGETIKGKKIFIASGTRPWIPPIEGIDTANYPTSDTMLQMEDLPSNILIIGGGYIGVEYGHFFEAMGAGVTIIEMADRLVPYEEPEISDLLKDELGRRMDIYTGTAVLRVGRKDRLAAVLTRNLATGEKTEFIAEKLLIAAGRTPNSDLLSPEKTGVQTDRKGYILVNDYMETTRKDIYAVGDAIGKQMFTHTANREAWLAVHNAIHDRWEKMDFSAAPHAVFSHPQIASVGLTEAEARKNHRVLVGRARYYDQAMGMALQESSGFAKVILEQESGRILGFHIIGPQAAVLVQEVVNVMAREGTAQDIHAGMHIHPALSDVVTAAFGNAGRGEGL